MIREDLAEGLATRVPCQPEEVCKQVQHLKEQIKSMLPNLG